MTDIERDVMEYDVVAVGAGPAGLACAIRLKQLSPDTTGVRDREGLDHRRAHPVRRGDRTRQPLDALLPGWRDNPPPICVPVTARRIPADDEDLRRIKTPIVPPQMHNKGNFIVSLGALCAWLAPQAEALGVEIYPGFAAAETLHDEDGRVAGVRIGDMGVAKDGTHKPGYTQGIDIRAKVTVLAEGARGHLTKRLIKRFDLAADCDPQGYSIGIKELWQVPEERVSPGQDRAFARLAAAHRHLRRQLPVPPGQGPHRARLHQRAGLQGSAIQAVGSLPAMEEPSVGQIRCSKAAPSSRPARARSSPAATSRCPSARCPARC